MHGVTCYVPPLSLSNSKQRKSHYSSSRAGGMVYPDGATCMKEPKEGKRPEKTQIAKMYKHVHIYTQVKPPVWSERTCTQRTLTVIYEFLYGQIRIESKGMRI